MTVSRQTIANAGVGFLVGVVLLFVPLVSLVAPLVGGGVAGYRERGGPKAGLVPGALAGAFIAVGGLLLRTALVAFRFGIVEAFPVQGIPLSTLLAGFLGGGALTLLSVLGTVVVATIGGGLGGFLEEDLCCCRGGDVLSNALSDDQPVWNRMVRFVVCLVCGVSTFLAVALGVTVVLNFYIWPSAHIGLPVGAIVGAVVAVLADHVLTTLLEKRDRQGKMPGRQ